MRFTCDSCGALYSVADERVRGKVVRVRCRSCKNRIIVDGRKIGAPSGFAGEADASRGEEAGSTEADPSGGAHKPAGEVREGQAGSDDDADFSRSKGKGYDSSVVGSWFAIIENEQVGPFSFDELVIETASGRLNRNTYVWKEGLEKWKQAGSVGELTDLFPKADSRRGKVNTSPAVEEKEEPDLEQPRERDDGELGELFGEAEAEQSGQGEPSQQRLEELLGRRELFEDKPDDEDPFAKALAEEAAASAGSDSGHEESCDSDVEGPPRETTNVFIMASRIKDQKSPIRIAAFIAGMAGLVLAVGFVLNHTTGLNLAGLVPLGSERREVLPWEPTGEATELRELLLGIGREEPFTEVEEQVTIVAPSPARESEVESRLREEEEAERASVDPERIEMLSDLYQQADRKAISIRPRTGADDDREVEATESPIDPEAIHRRLADTQSAFETCIQHELRRNPRFRGGRVEMVLSVAPSGVVRDARLSDRVLHRSEVGQCITRAARRMMLPSFSGEETIDIIVPLMLAAAH